MTSAAATRRFDAIGTLMDATRRAVQAPTGTTVQWYRAHADRAILAAEVRALADLGRTDRWRDSVEGWAHAIETAEDERVFRWAVDQYGIYACHAAE